MTSEQLDEIEKLADGWHRTGLTQYAEEVADNGRALVKALREALAASDREEAACFRLEVERNAARDQRAMAERMLRELCEALQNSIVAQFCVTGEDYAKGLPRVEAALNEARAEVERLKAERDEARKWLEGICAEFEGAVAHADWRASGSKGMSVTFTGDFASCVQLPGAINRMRWWAREFRAALKEGE